MDLDQLRHLIGTRRPWHSLPQQFYLDREIFEIEKKAIFERSWAMIGLEAQLDRPGAYIATKIGSTPVMVLRNKEGDIAGFYNSCRHRGAQICASGTGRVPRLVCPYHQWTYDLDGRLLVARRMGEDFDKGEHGLRPIRIETVAGCIYACLAEDAPDFTPFRAALEAALEPQGLRNAKVAHVARLEEHANWKLVVENGRECHHCAVCHPELIKAFPINMADGATFHENTAEMPFMARMREVGLGHAAVEDSWWQVGRFPFSDGVVSYSVDGKPLADKRLCDLNGGDIGSLRWAIEPNNFCHATGDCAIMVNMDPVDVLRTDVTATWFVHKDAVEGVDYHIDRLIHVWDQTNRQDRDLAENNQRGVSGSGYVPGPYSPEAESYVNSFVDWYCTRMLEIIPDQIEHAALNC
ncbi:MAG: aromatic ring-hydroxylating dioxygenase subunit alpha [Sphingopyxis sp.]|nr:aromatic ring-hydroxylating dioxygenase subunit alpha [Sphingopyxis sp.]